MIIFTLLGILCLTRMTTGNHCTVTGTKKNRMVDLDNAGDGVVVASLGSRTSMTSSDCVNTCCHTAECDVAVFDSRNDSNTDTNCHMYTCEGCELKKKSSFTSYFISNENDVKTTTKGSINSDASSTRTSSTSSPMTTSEKNNSPEFKKIVLNKPTDTINVTDTVPEAENSVKGNLQESEIDIPLVIPDFASKLDDSEIIQPGSAGTDRPTKTASPNVNSDSNISPVVPGSKTGSVTSDTSGAQASDSESNPSTKTSDDSPSGPTNTDTSPTSDNTPSEKTPTGSNGDTSGSPIDKSSSDTSPSSDSTQIDSSSGKPSTVPNGDSSISNIDSSTDTAATSDTVQTESSNDKSTTDTDTAVSSTASKVPLPSDATQIDSSQDNPTTDTSADSAVSDTAPSSDTSPPADATQLDIPPGNPTDGISSDSNPPSSDSGSRTPSPKSTSENVPNKEDIPTTQTKVTSSSDNSKEAPVDSVTSGNDAGSINPPTSQTDNSETPKATSNSATTADQPSVADVPEGLPTDDVTGSTAKQTGLTDNQASTDSGSKAEEADTQQDLPDNYNAPFVNHPTMVATALIAALSFGVIFFFAVTAIVGKRCYDGWQRRHYSRVDYLINGIYN